MFRAIKTILLLPVLLGTVVFVFTAVLLLFLVRIAFGNDQ